ncbi:MAG: hypothetical protein GOP50_10485 [Candidatus Heimdallarchaeota archaeon]|nr:hypothetical protein [Candidatus Heimdallarchaeota archaeon]
MFRPFSIRHPNAFEEEPIKTIVDSISETDKKALDNFAKKCINFTTNNEVSTEIRDLAVDIAICTRDFKSVLDLTTNLNKPEFFLYRAYAFSRINQTNKIISLKLQFQQKYGDSLGGPLHMFITGGLEFLLLYYEQNYSMALTTVEELESHTSLHLDLFEGELYTFLIYTLAAQAFLLVNDFGKVEELARTVLQSAVKQNDPYFQSVALNLITNVFINQGEFKKAQKMLNAAIVPTEETGLSADRASLLNNSAKLEIARGDYERSIRLLRQIHQLVSKNPRAKAVSATNIAELSLLLENYEEAKEMLDIALQLEAEHDLNLIQPYLLSAWIAIERGNFELAESSILICKQRLDEVGELRVKPNIYYYEGMLFKKQGKLDEAIEALQIANKAASDMNNVEFLIKAQFELASLHLDRFNDNNELSDYSAVLSYLNNLTYLSEEQFIPKLMCDIQLIKGLLLIHGGKTKKAVEALTEAYDLAKRFNYTKILRDSQALLGEINKDQKIGKFAEILEERGFQQTDRMSEVVKKYQGFKFVKAPKLVASKLYGLAIVESDTAVMKYRFTTKHEYKDEASLVPMLVAAINIFSQSVLEEDLILTEVSQHGRDLLIDRVGEYIIIAITEKITFNLKNQFGKYVESLRKLIPKIEPLGVRDTHIDVLDRVTNVYFLQEGILEERAKTEKLDLDRSLKELGEMLERVEVELEEMLEMKELEDELQIIEKVDLELKKIDTMLKSRDPTLLAYIETYGIPIAKSSYETFDLTQTETVDLNADEVQLHGDEVEMNGFEHELPLRVEDLADMSVPIEENPDDVLELDGQLKSIEQDLEDMHELEDMTEELTPLDTSEDEVALDSEEVVIQIKEKKLVEEGKLELESKIEEMSIPVPDKKTKEETKEEKEEISQEEEEEETAEDIKEKFEEILEKADDAIDDEAEDILEKAEEILEKSEEVIEEEEEEIDTTEEEEEESNPETDTSAESEESEEIEEKEEEVSYSNDDEIIINNDNDILLEDNSISLDIEEETLQPQIEEFRPKEEDLEDFDFE